MTVLRGGGAGSSSSSAFDVGDFLLKDDEGVAGNERGTAAKRRVDIEDSVLEEESEEGLEDGRGAGMLEEEEDGKKEEKGGGETGKEGKKHGERFISQRMGQEADDGKKEQPSEISLDEDIEGLTVDEEEEKGRGNAPAKRAKNTHSGRGNERSSRDGRGGGEKDDESDGLYNEYQHSESLSLPPGAEREEEERAMMLRAKKKMRKPKAKDATSSTRRELVSSSSSSNAGGSEEDVDESNKSYGEGRGGTGKNTFAFGSEELSDVSDATVLERLGGGGKGGGSVSEEEARKEAEGPELIKIEESEDETTTKLKRKRDGKTSKGGSASRGLTKRIREGGSRDSSRERKRHAAASKGRVRSGRHGDDETRGNKRASGDR